MVVVAAHPLRMSTAITAQNGARLKPTVNVAVAGCKKPKRPIGTPLDTPLTRERYRATFRGGTPGNAGIRRAARKFLA